VQGLPASGRHYPSVCTQGLPASGGHRPST